MESIDIGWASFFNDSHVNFSKEFQTEMANQLKSRFDLMLGIENYADDNDFKLIVGMTPLKLTYQDGYGFGLVEIIDKYSFSKTITFYWQSADEENEKVINSTEANSRNIKFGWCADFEKDYFLNFHKNRLVENIQSKVLGFKYVANFELYPDLSFNFVFKVKPSKSNLDEIFNLMNENFKNSYVSEVTGENTQFSVFVDFQSTDVAEGISEIDQFMRDYISGNLKGLTKSISIN